MPQTLVRRLGMTVLAFTAGALPLTMASPASAAPLAIPGTGDLLSAVGDTQEFSSPVLPVALQGVPHLAVPQPEQLLSRVPELPSMSELKKDAHPARLAGTVRHLKSDAKKLPGGLLGGLGAN